MLHRFCREGDMSAIDGALSAPALERLLEFLGHNNLLPPDEWMWRLAQGRLRSSDLCLTFDDGLRSQWEIALPVLQRHGLRAFWFVYSCAFEGHPVRSEIYSHVAGLTGGMAQLIDDLFPLALPALRSRLATVEFAAYAATMRESAPYYSERDLQYRFLRNHPATQREVEELMDELLRRRGYNVADVARDLWMTNDHLRWLSDRGHSVGLHSYSHPYAIGQLTEEQQQVEYARNFEHIEATTGVTPEAMSHPLNSYGVATLQVLQRVGIRCGFRANMLPPSEQDTQARHLELPREDPANLIGLTRQGSSTIRE